MAVGSACGFSCSRVENPRVFCVWETTCCQIAGWKMSIETLRFEPFAVCCWNRRLPCPTRSVLSVDSAVNIALFPWKNVQVCGFSRVLIRSRPPCVKWSSSISIFPAFQVLFLFSKYLFPTYGEKSFFELFKIHLVMWSIKGLFVLRIFALFFVQKLLTVEWVVGDRIIDRPLLRLRRETSAPWLTESIFPPFPEF